MRAALIAALVIVAGAASAGLAAPTALPDLVVSAVEEPPIVRKARSSFLLRHTVRNRGDGAAARTATRVYLSLDRVRGRADLALQPSAGVPPLRPRGLARPRPSLRIPAGTRHASYFVIACADALRRVREANERNNCRASVKRLTVTGA